MARMTEEECGRFVSEGARTAAVGTVRPDGRPHVAVVWYVLEDDTLVFTTWHEAVKAINLRHNPQISICIDDEKPPFSYVQVEGTAVMTDRDPDLGYWATRIAGRYMGEDQAEAYGKRNSVEGELLVRVKITKMVGQKGVANW